MTDMPTTNIFIDTNVFVALRDTNDSTHQKALEIAKTLKEKTVRFYTSSDIIGETLTVLSRKLGKAIALDWYKDLQKSDIREIFVDETIHQKARSLFNKTRPKNISFIDCSSVVIMRENRIRFIFSFDEDFKSLGIRLQPTP